jgi:predicted transcriptional regulator
MAKLSVKLSDQLRQAVNDSGLSRYRIAKELGIVESAISKFMSRKGGLSMEVLDRLAQLLELNLDTSKRSMRRGK